MIGSGFSIDRHLLDPLEGKRRRIMGNILRFVSLKLHVFRQAIRFVSVTEPSSPSK